MDTHSLKRIYEEWEPAEFTALMENSVPIAFVPEVLATQETLKNDNANIIDLVAQEVDTWPNAPTMDVVRALRVLTLYTDETFAWHASNDILQIRILDLLYTEDFRAHSDGAYQYIHGNWAFIEELKYQTIRKLERHLGLVANMMKILRQRQTPRTVGDVFEVLQETHATLETKTSVTASDFAARAKRPEEETWACEGGRIAMELIARYTTKGKTSEMIDSYGLYFQIEKPEPAHAHVDFDNVTLRLKRDGGGQERFRAVQKSPTNNCYFGLPVSLEYRVPAAEEEEMRCFLCTSFAGNVEGRRMDMALESLVWYNEILPQLALLFTGDGGNAKSAKAVLRANVMGAHHAFVSGDCFQTPDEFRKQGCHFARAKVCTVQENQAGVPWLEPIVKCWLGGEFLWCRPLFGKSTTPYSWRKTAKYFEWNRTYPSVRGNWRQIMTLRAFWRRLAVVELGAVFTSDPSLVNISGRVFPEKELTSFLESGLARLIYIRSFLIPFIQSHSADECRSILKNPSEKIVNDTKRVVVQMANGGLELPSEWCSVENREQVVRQARELLVKIHVELHGRSVVKTYAVGRLRTSLPGTVSSSKKSKAKIDHLVEAIQNFPFLFRIEGNDLHRLDIDAVKLDTLITESGDKLLAGGLDGWGVYWDTKASVMEDFSDEWQEPIGLDVLTDPENISEEVSLDETVNIRHLEDAVCELNHYEHDKRMAAERYVARHRSEGCRVGDASTIRIIYSRKYGIPGRRHARGPCAQRLNRTLRAMCFQYDIGSSSCDADEEIYDVDVDNSFIKIMWNELQGAVGDAVYIEYHVFTALVENPVVFREFLSKYFDIPVKDAKKMLIALLHYAKPQAELPLLWALVLEMRMAAQVILGLPKFGYLQGRFAERRHPVASRLHYALSSIEDNIIAGLEDVLRSEMGGRARVLVFMFDGAVITVSGEGGRAALRQILDTVGQTWDVHFKMDKL